MNFNIGGGDGFWLTSAVIDEVWIYNVLEHVETVAAVVATAKAILREGGFLHVVEFVGMPKR
ncbi:MAG: hypothetical protein V1703_04695, partial [Candidatus Altiarchaeota archaeon]